MGLRTQFPVGLLLALFLGYALSSAPGLEIVTETPVEPTPFDAPAPATDAPTVTPGPFVTRDSVWVVEVRLWRARAPELTAVNFLPTGRLLPMQGGDSTLRLLDDQDGSLYELSFQPVFLRSESAELLDNVDLSLLLPTLPEGSMLELETPTGQTRFDLPEIPS